MSTAAVKGKEKERIHLRAGGFIAGHQSHHNIHGAQGCLSVEAGIGYVLWDNKWLHLSSSI